MGIRVRERENEEFGVCRGSYGNRFSHHLSTGARPIAAVTSLDPDCEFRESLRCDSCSGVACDLDAKRRSVHTHTRNC